MKNIFKVFLLLSGGIFYAQGAADNTSGTKGLLKKAWSCVENGKNDEALKLFEKAASTSPEAREAFHDLGVFLNHPKALCEVAEKYECGKGVLQDYKRAFELYQQATKKDSVVAQCRLGDMYVTGKGCEANLKIASFWYAQAAKKGSPYARELLTLKTSVVALKVLENFGNRGDLHSFVDLGGLYERGPGATLKKDLDQAMKFYTKAAEGGNLRGQLALAFAYMQRNNEEKAHEWFQKAEKTAQEEGHEQIADVARQCVVASFAFDILYVLNSTLAKIAPNSSSSLSR